LPEDALFQSLEDGTLHRNFMGYTTHPAREMVAFGMSAISDVGGAFLQNAHEIPEWEEGVCSGGLAVMRGLRRSEDDDLRRAAIQSLMCRMHLDLDELDSEFGPADFKREWRDLEPLAELGLCEVRERRVDVLPPGRLFLRHLAMVFDAYLRRKKQGQRFSQTV
jgi:oxygen-independent coproporphyrinogen-3 oxidase